MQKFKKGDKVQAISARSFGWGNVSKGDIGIVRDVTSHEMLRYEYEVDFPTQEGWSAGEEELILVESKTTITKKIMNLIKKSLLGAEEKALIEAGYMTENLELTTAGMEALNFIQFTEHRAKLVEMANNKIKETREEDAA